MTSVRLATLADTATIVEIYSSHHPGWQRLDPDGKMAVTPYADLSLYERWQRGGHWMSIETGAVHLNRLLAGSGVPLVAEDDEGHVLAEAEIYESHEPAPFGHHLNIGAIVTHADYLRRDFGAVLVKYILEMARLMKCERVTASHNSARDFFMAQGFRHTRSGRGVRLPAQEGRAFYQATELTERSPEQVKGWLMALGRYQSSRQEWERLFPQDWAAGIPELLNQAVAHVKLTVTGQNAILYLYESVGSDQQQIQPGEVMLACWSARPLSNPLLTAVRDRVFRDGYQSFLTFVMDADLPQLGPDAQPTDYTQDFYEMPV
ncbi:MAG TPA: GNAT family N-acetyltransferase [Aggregatilineales bacterium]|nr:GNAT family N-acetyltransferase [Aggregatilineales bacterium]